MTAHPHRRGSHASRDGTDAMPFSDVGEYVQHADQLDHGSEASVGDVDGDLALTDDLFDLFDDSGGSCDRYGSLDPGHWSRPRATTPQPLAGLTDLDLPLCRASHCALFGLLEDVGDFDRLVATSEFCASAEERRMPARPMAARTPGTRSRQRLAPDPGSGRQTPPRAGDAMETNPSVTFGSTTSFAEVLLDRVLDIVEPDRVVLHSEIEALTSVTLRSAALSMAGPGSSAVSTSGRPPTLTRLTAREPKMNENRTYVCIHTVIVVR